MKEVNKKKLKKYVVLALGITLIVGGSLAWQDVKQHKTNTFATKSVAHSIVLVEDFEPIEGWTLGQVIKKEVSVRNGQESDNTEKYSYNDGYVRLQLREFMGVADQSTVTSEDRLMVQTNGDFYRFETQAEAEAQASNLMLELDRVIGLTGINDKGVEHFYLKTAADDLNGQYGKFLIIGITTGTLKSIQDGSDVIDIDKDVKDKHNTQDGNNKEDGSDYKTHIWAEDQDSYTPTDNKFIEYVKWSLGSDVITLKQWKDNFHSKRVAKWILDTDDTTNGYVYWGQKIEHSTTATFTSVTSKLLEQITLIKQPQGHAEYRVHVNMDGVSYDELDNWNSDGNHEIIEVLKDKEKDDLLIEVENDPDYLDKYFKNVTKWDALDEAVKSVKDVLVSSHTQQQLVQAYDDLQIAYDAVKNGNGYGKLGEQVYISDRKYTYLASDEHGNQALVFAEALDQNDYEKMGYASQIDGVNRIKFADGTVYNGYEGSHLEAIDKAFFNTFVKDSINENKVLPVIFNQESYPITSGWKTREDAPTTVSDLGEAKAFSLSVSDYNINGPISGTYLKDVFQIWLRSPSENGNSAAQIGILGDITSSNIYNRGLVRPAMWVKIPN